MTRLNLGNDLLEWLVIGGSFYGGGGGGATGTGLEMGRQALAVGRPYIVDLEDLPSDALLLTVSAVGAPAGEGVHAGPQDYVAAVELFRRITGKPIAGFITNECGGIAAVNGWIQSAATGLPVVDAPCNGRAHPTGSMGSMGLNLVEDYISEQAVASGRWPDGTSLEVFIRASVGNASGMVRKASMQAGGLVAVARNPVTVSYAKSHAAPGALRRCIEVGRAILDGQSKAKDGTGVTLAIEGATAAAGGTIAMKGKVAHRQLESVGGFDLGTLIVDDGRRTIELTFLNEYLAMEDGETHQRFHTFPDLIMTLDLNTGLPITTADTKTGQDLAVVVVPRERLILGAGMRDPGLLAEVERLCGKELVKYVF